ncbi:MAG: gluconate 5-dehydrogenase [Paludibacteraceae bacterium]|nr:gluconate 5-dehydrogenase [Paludibacteraceae bacterium]
MENVLDSFSLKGKIALVTGATYGIGMAMAKALGMAGARIAFNARRADQVQQAEAEYKSMGFDAKGYVFDITKEEQVNQFVPQIEKDFGGSIDILVNNAGIIKRISVVEMTVAEFKEVIDVDLIGAFIMAKAVAPGMIKKGSGKIINVCSLMSELGRETVTAYAAAKGGLKMLTKNLACEWAEHNIQVNGIGPGYIATPQTAPLREPGHPFDQFIKGRTPAARWGLPEDLQGPTVFLASEASNFVNGQILYVDGGILAYLGKLPK